MSLTKIQLNQITEKARQDNNSLSQHERDLRASGFMYANIKQKSCHDKTVIFAEEFINLITWQKLYHIEYFNRPKWWKKKTFDNKGKALKLYNRMAQRIKNCN